MAATKYIRTARKLQTACSKVFGVKLLIDQRQWYHKDRDMAMTIYTVYKADNIDSTKRGVKSKLFQTYSQIQLVLFLRDYWYALNGWEIPTDNKVWEELKQKYEQDGKPGNPEEAAALDTEADGETNSYRTAVCNELYTVWKSNGGASADTGISR